MAGCGPQTGACQLAAELEVCPECYSGDVRCSYGDVTVTEPSCDGCQARSALARELCDAGVQDSRAEIELGMECEVISGVDDDA